VEELRPLTINEAARAFNCPAYMIRTQAKKGEFPVIKVGNRIYIVRAVFEDYLRNGGKRLNEPEQFTRK
jgi:hypothetical protein